MNSDAVSDGRPDAGDDLPAGTDGGQADPAADARPTASMTTGTATSTPRARSGLDGWWHRPVSYTHLTLPTILRV